MGVFLAIFMIVTTVSVAIFLLVRAYKDKYGSRSKSKVAIIHLMSVSLMIVSDIVCGGFDVVLRLPLDMILSLSALLVLTSSVLEEHVAVKLSGYLSYPVWLMSLYYILQITGICPSLSADHILLLFGVVSIAICCVFLLAIVLRMREIRQIMRYGNVWSSVCLTIDVVYMMISVIYVIALLLSVRVSISCTYVVSFVISFLFICELAALGLRVSLDSLFVIWRRHESRIVESMKISHADVTRDSSKIDDIYKDIYTRLVALFETDKPYLNSELTIQDIVKVTFTNKLYISRAISQFTGRNFCQFVNYYRVLHSIQLFRDNPDLKVIELATRSGFNSNVSYSMAFRLYMSELPSDWCRREKLKIKRAKK